MWQWQGKLTLACIGIGFEIDIIASMNSFADTCIILSVNEYFLLFCDHKKAPRWVVNIPIEAELIHLCGYVFCFFCFFCILVDIVKKKLWYKIFEITVEPHCNLKIPKLHFSIYFIPTEPYSLVKTNIYAHISPNTPCANIYV